MRRRAIISALLLIGVGVILGTTVFRADIAQATGLAQSVTVNNTTSNPVPVNVTNTSVPVHEQGTANVNVTNSSLSVAAAPPINDGGSAVLFHPGASPFDLSSTATASALSIHLTDEVAYLSLSLGDDDHSALFYGPASGGNSTIVLALSRPITFNKLVCQGGASAQCSVSWVGNKP
jgi:hypothetical protein